MPYVDDNGEVSECPRCKRLDTLVDDKDLIIEELQRDIRRWALRNAALRRERNLPVNDHPLYRDAEIAFKEWKAKCNHPRSPFTPDRFWLVVPYLEDENYGLRMVLTAISGAAYDPWERRLKNGKIKKMDGWDYIFEKADRFEEFVNKAPTTELRAVA